MTCALNQPDPLQAAANQLTALMTESDLQMIKATRTQVTIIAEQPGQQKRILTVFGYSPFTADPLYSGVAP